MPKVGISPRLEPSPGGETGPHGGTRLSRPATTWAAALRPGPGLMHLSSCSRELGEPSRKWSRVAARCARPRWRAGAGRGGHPTLQPPMTASPQMTASPRTHVPVVLFLAQPPLQRTASVGLASSSLHLKTKSKSIFFSEIAFWKIHRFGRVAEAEATMRFRIPPLVLTKRPESQGSLWGTARWSSSDFIRVRASENIRSGGSVSGPDSTSAFEGMARCLKGTGRPV